MCRLLKDTHSKSCALAPLQRYFPSPTGSAVPSAPVYGGQCIFPLSVFASLTSSDGASPLPAFKQNHSRPDHQERKPELRRDSEPGEQTHHPVRTLMHAHARSRTRAASACGLSLCPPARKSQPGRDWIFATDRFLTSSLSSSWCRATPEPYVLTCISGALFPPLHPSNLFPPRQLDFGHTSLTL